MVALAGPGFKEAARKYYRVPFGASLEKLFEDNLDGDEVRLINGNVMWGNEVTHKTVLIIMVQNILLLKKIDRGIYWDGQCLVYVNTALIG